MSKSVSNKLQIIALAYVNFNFFRFFICTVKGMEVDFGKVDQ